MTPESAALAPASLACSRVVALPTLLPLLRTFGAALRSVALRPVAVPTALLPLLLAFAFG